MVSPSQHDSDYGHGQRNYAANLHVEINGDMSYYPRGANRLAREIRHAYHMIQIAPYTRGYWLGYLRLLRQEFRAALKLVYGD